MTRRELQKKAILFFNGVLAAGMSLPALAYLVIPGRQNGESAWTDAGDVSELPLDKPHEATLQRERRDGWRKAIEKTSAWIVRRDEGVTAFAPQCTHLGCGYRWVEDQNHFLCPCHDSTFSVDGDVLSGPAPRPLDRYEVRQEGARLWLGPIRRSDEA